MDLFFTLVTMGGVAFAMFEWGYFRGRRTGQCEVRRVFTDALTSQEPLPMPHHVQLVRVNRTLPRYGWRA